MSDPSLGKGHLGAVNLRFKHSMNPELVKGFACPQTYWGSDGPVGNEGQHSAGTFGGHDSGRRDDDAVPH